MAVVADGGEKLAALALALNRAGETELERELVKGVRRPLLALRPVLAASARSTLPRRGGLAEQIARSPVRVTTRQRGYLIAKLVARNEYNIRRIDRGVNRHPVHADPGKTRDEWAWVDQPVTPGWFTRPTDDARDDLVRAFDDALDAVARQVEIEVLRG